MILPEQADINGALGLLVMIILYGPYHLQIYSPIPSFTVC